MWLSNPNALVPAEDFSFKHILSFIKKRLRFFLRFCNLFIFIIFLPNSSQTGENRTRVKDYFQHRFGLVSSIYSSRTCM